MDLPSVLTTSLEDGRSTLVVNDSSTHEEAAMEEATLVAESSSIATNIEQATLRRNTLSLVVEHWQLLLLLAFNLVMMDMNGIFTSFLLVSTSAGCGYHAEAGPFVQSQTVSLVAVLFWRPLSALLTDALPRRNHTLLVVAAVLELGGLLVMLLLVALSHVNELSPWYVLGLSVFKQCAEVQMTNSIYKMFKMRLHHRCGLSSCDSQCHVVSAVGIVSELVEIVFDLATCVTAYVLLTHGASFASVKYVYFSVTLLATLCCVGVGTAISCKPAAFYGGGYGGSDTLAAPAAGMHAPLLHKQQPPVDATVVGNDTSETEATVVDEVVRSKLEEVSTRCCRGMRGIFCVPVALGSIIVMATLYTSQEVLYSKESLDIPSANDIMQNTTATADNFCAGYLGNTVYQDMWENVFYLLGTLFYIIVLKHTKPMAFFRWLLPIGMTLLIAVAAVIALPGMKQLVLVLAMESVVAFDYFFFLYAKYLSIAAVSSEFYGMYSLVVGSMQSACDILIYAAMEREVSSLAFRVVMFTAMGATVLLAVGFSVVRRKELIEHTTTSR